MFSQIIGASSWGSTLRVTLAAVAVAGTATLFAGHASAAPLAQANGAISQAAQDSTVTLVRDGCGRGMRFSNSRQACVEDFDGGPRVVEPGCPRGTRYSERRGACVEIERQVDPGAAIVNGIINGVVGGGGCPPGTRWSNGRGRCVYD